MAVITISRQFGAGGKTLGEQIAKRLGYAFADENIIQKIAELAKVSPRWVESVEREAGGRLSRLISRMVSKSLVDKILKDERGYIDEQIYLDYLVVLISQMADEGDVVILGRGSQYILNDLPEACHVLLISSFDNRVRFIEEHYDITEYDAVQLVKANDKRRANLYRKLGKQDYDQPDLYHMVVNTSRVSLEQAERLIVRMVRQQEGDRQSAKAETM